MSIEKNPITENWTKHIQLDYMAWETLPLEDYMADTPGPRHSAPIHALEGVIADNEVYCLAEARILLKAAVKADHLQRAGDWLKTNSERYCEVVREIE